jgi:hypothetical protein
MVKDKLLERIKAIKRISRIDTGGPHGRAGIHVDKRERRLRHMSTQDWLEEAEEDKQLETEIEECLQHTDSEDAIKSNCPNCGQPLEIWHVCVDYLDEESDN